MAISLKKLQSLFSKKDKHEKPSIQGPVTIVVLKFNAHCPNCCKDVGKCIEKVTGVVSVDVDSEKQQATVKGAFDVENLKAKVFKKLTKRVEIVSQFFPSDNKKDDKKKEGFKNEDKEEKWSNNDEKEKSNNKDEKEKKGSNNDDDELDD